MEAVTTLAKELDIKRACAVLNNNITTTDSSSLDVLDSPKENSLLETPSPEVK